MAVRSIFKIPAFATSIVSVLMLILAFIVSIDYPTNSTANGSDAEVSASPSPTGDAPGDDEKCKTWKLDSSGYANNRWFGEGIASIRDAQTNEQAVAAASDWLEEIRTDPILFEAGAEALLKNDIDPATLFSNRCATDAAVKLELSVLTTLAESKIVPDDAPANGYNTGVENGVVVGSPTPGIGGDRKAIKITLPDGSEVWIMARCGNIVTPGPSVLPPGTTDNPPVCPYNPNLPPDSPECLQPKVPSEDPAANGNAPEGGGLNEDPGPGTYIPPSEMEQPPATPRVNPPAPAPAPSTPEAPAPAPVGSTPDPAPAPAPEPSAPTPEAPAEGCSPPPGMTTC